MQTRPETQPSSTSEAPVDPILGAAVPGADRPDRPMFEPAGRKEKLLPGLVVGIVAAAGLAAALMTPRVNAPEFAAQQAPSEAVNPNTIVTAPPLTPPITAANRQGDRKALAMGAGAACENCGTVQMVVAVHGYAQNQPSGYQMHIRMDDGTTRTVEQRGALPAGSRVLLKGDSLRALTPRPGEG
jgi:hypothetical protein